jgi:hypothetical protein
VQDTKVFAAPTGDLTDPVIPPAEGVIFYTSPTGAPDDTVWPAIGVILELTAADTVRIAAGARLILMAWPGERMPVFMIPEIVDSPEGGPNTTPWRHPSETSGLYPKLSVSDNMVSGSIVLAGGRLPLWALVGTAIYHDWTTVEKGWLPTEHYGFEPDDLATFLTNLLEARGEFGRLLLTLANAERLENEQVDQAIQEQAPDEPVVQIALGDEDDGVHLPGAWWQDPDLKAPVLDQLRRCVAVLEA